MPSCMQNFRQGGIARFACSWLRRCLASSVALNMICMSISSDN